MRETFTIPGIERHEWAVQLPFAFHAPSSYSVQLRRVADANGCFHLWTIRPSPYPIPHDGTVGRMLKAQDRHPFRPEHIHFLVEASGHRKLVTHVFAAGDEYLDSDVVFGVKDSLVREYVRHSGGTTPDGEAMQGEWFSLHYDFSLAADPSSGR